MSDEPAQLIGQPTHIRTFEIVQNVTGFLEGSINDWPAQMQDQIFEALDRLAERVQLPVCIVAAYCDVDYGEAQDRSQDRIFVRVIASEIVASYEPKNKSQELYEMFKKGRTH